MSPKDEEDKLRQEAIALVARLSDREATAEDRQTFERWQSQSAAHARVFDKIAHVWGHHALDSVALHVARNESGIIVTQIPVSGQRRRHVWAFAACLVVLLLGAWYFDLATRFQADHQTAVGERRTVRLPDQSLVTLNTHTSIATSFDETVRLVHVLKGEALFKVQHDPDRPFIVEGRDTNSRAVGTEFVVRSQSGSDRVTVIEGVVEVSSHNGAGTTERLTAGSMVETEEGRLRPVRPVDTSTASAWLKGLLIVDDVPLVQVIEEVQRYHSGTIVLWNRHISEMRVTGTYKLEDPVKILYHLSKTFPLHKIALANRVVILF